jgi:hypothetical protein
VEGRCGQTAAAAAAIYNQNIGTASTCKATKLQKLQLHARYRMLKYREMKTRKLRISYYNAV